VNQECSREQDVLDAVATGRWPDRVDVEIRDHVRGCPVCGDAAELAPLFFADRDAAWQEAEVPSASSVWWRAQMRARREAAERAARPMVLVERAALVYAAVGLFGLGVLFGPWLRAWGRATVDILQALAPTQDALTAVATNIGVLPIAAASALLLLAPLALYWADRRP
jgi:hypothetical protein